jgi:hypothetical protein
MKIISETYTVFDHSLTNIGKTDRPILTEKTVRIYTIPEEPTLLELAANFAGAMERWVKSGFKTVTAEEYIARKEACDTCELWDGSARLSLGKCKAPSCGCTKFKRFLRSEICRHPKGSRWPSLSVN